jgi:hypothetical protein
LTRFLFTIAVCFFLVAYLLLVFLKRPATGTGRFFFKLSLVNVASWIILLPLSSRGHTPPLVIYGTLLWFINSPLLIVLAITLWMDFKERDENKVFLRTATTYLIMNVLVMWLIPSVLLIFASFSELIDR